MSGIRTLKVRVDGDHKGLNNLATGGASALNRFDKAVGNVGKTAGRTGKDVDEFGNKARKSGKDADAAGKHTGRFVGQLGGIASGAGLAALGLGALAGAWISATAQALVEVERLRAQTDTVIRSMNVAWTDTDHIVHYAEKIEELTGLEMETVQEGQNLLLTFGNIRNEVGKGNNVFDQATVLMTDLSVATGKAMPEAATLLGKALNAPITGLSALSRVGIQFTEQQKTQIKALVDAGDVMGAQKIILAELTKQFGGSAAAFGETTAGQVLKLQNQFGNLSEEMLAGLLPALNAVMDVGVDVLDWVKENGDLVANLAIALTGLVVSWLAVHGAIKLVNGVSSLFQTISAALTGNIGGLGGAFTNMGKAARIASLSMGAIGVIASLIGTALAIFGGESEEAAAKQTSLAEAGKLVAKAIAEQGGVIDNTVRQKTASSLADEGVLQKARQLGFELPRVTDAVLGEGDAYNSLKGDIETIIAAKEADLRQSQDRSGKTQEALQGEIDAYRALLGDIDGFIGGKNEAALAEEAATDATSSNTDAIQANIEAIQEQIRAVQEAAGIVLSAREAENQYFDAVANATQAIRDNGETLNVHTAKGRANRTALDGIAKSTLDLVESQAKNNASTNTLAASMGRGRAAFIRTAIQMGANERQANELADSLGLIPGHVRTTVELRDAYARRRAKEFADLIRNMPSEKVVNLRVSAQGGGHHLAGQATGGPVLAGHSYLVGERGPEILRMPNSIGGHIVPNHELGSVVGGDVVVYVTIDGQQLQGRIDRTVRENNRSIRRGATAGTGANR